MKNTILKLNNTDGNAYSILGKAIQAAKKAKWTSDEIAKYKKEAMAGDYATLLQVTMKYFDVK